jgi:hypothetical protein
MKRLTLAFGLLGFTTRAVATSIKQRTVDMSPAFAEMIVDRPGQRLTDARHLFQIAQDRRV